jgi:dephospho-CoA kinase
MKAQATRPQRLSVADDIVDNNGKTVDLVKQVTRLHNKYLQLAKQSRA